MGTGGRMGEGGSKTAGQAVLFTVKIINNHNEDSYYKIHAEAMQEFAGSY